MTLAAVLTVDVAAADVALAAVFTAERRYIIHCKSIGEALRKERLGLRARLSVRRRQGTR